MRRLGLWVLVLPALAGAQEGTGGPETPPLETPPPLMEEWKAPEPPAPEVRVRGEVRLVGGVDTGFEARREDGLSEHVVDGWGRASLAAEVKPSPTLRLVVEGRALWRGGAERGWTRSQSFFEPELGEAFLDMYTPRVDVRVGQQVLAFGANAAFAPTDVLNPRDLRMGLVLAEPEEAKRPVFAARALATLGPLTVTGVWAPFFTPHRYDVFGEDTALLQPGLGVAVPLKVDASIEDGLQPHLLETERPGLPGDVGLRVTGEVGGVRLGGSWVWFNEKLPQVTLDPELEALLRAQARGEPPESALVLSLQERLRAGEALATGRYARQHILALEASRLVGPVQLDADVGFSPAQTFLGEQLRPVRKPTVTWVLGASRAEASDFLYSVTYTGLAVPGVEAGALLVLLEPGTARGVARTAFLHLLVADARYTLLGDMLEVGLRGAFEVVQRSFLLSPRVSWRATEHLHVGLSAEVYGGASHSPLGYFDRNDQVLATVRLTL